MSQNDSLHLAQGFLSRMGSGAGPAVIDFLNDSRSLMERIRFEVLDIPAGDNRAVILGSLAAQFRQTGRIITTDFAIVLTIANSEIVRFQMLEDSFAVSRAARSTVL